MIKRKRWIVRDPYFYWKMINMALALAILVLAGMILLGGKRGWLVPAAFSLGVLMCAFEGIIQLSKGRKVLGYTCSIFSGLMIVMLIASIILLIW